MSVFDKAGNDAAAKPSGDTAAIKEANDTNFNPLLDDALNLNSQRALETRAQLGDSPIDPTRIPGFGTTIVSYKDAALDNELDFTRAINLQVRDVPNNCQVSAWKDDVGYFFYFTDGKDGRKHHQIPPTVQFIQIVQENGRRQVLSVSELKRSVDQAIEAQKKRNGQ